MEGADGVRSTAHAGDHAIRQRAGALEDLRARLAADHRLQFAHQVRIGMRADGRSQAIEGIERIRDPVAEGLVDGGAQGAITSGDRHHGRAHQAHASDIGRLALHVHFAHVHHAGQANARAGCGGGNAMLPGAGLGDDALRAHAPRQQGLAQRVVDLVRAGVRQVFALEPDLRAPALREIAHGRQRSGTSHPVAQLAGQFIAEFAASAGWCAPRHSSDRMPAPVSRECSARHRVRTCRRRRATCPPATGPAGAVIQPCRLPLLCFSTSSTRANAARAVATNEPIRARLLLPGRFLDSTGHIHAKRPHVGNGFRDVGRRQSAGENQLAVPSPARAPRSSRPPCPCRCAALRTAVRPANGTCGIRLRTAQHRPAGHPCGQLDADEVLSIGLQHIGLELARISSCNCAAPGCCVTATHSARPRAGTASSAACCG